MDFSANKIPVEVIKERPFGGTYFRDIYSGVNSKQYRNSWKEFDELKNIHRGYYCSNYYDVSVNKYGVKCGTSVKFGKIKVGLILQTFMVGFSGILDIGQPEDLQMMK